jgi:pimeloyl-ACP methyl ester carboxylesterase
MSFDSLLRIGLEVGVAQLEERTTSAPVFTEGFAEADGFRIRYAEAGQGELLVCFHGAGGMRVSRSHELLAEQHRVMIFEVPGFGNSPVNERTASIQDLAGTMAQAVASLGTERFNLMGNSFGGRLALWLAVQYPERVDSLVLAAPAAIRPEGGGRAGVAPEDRLGLLYAHPERQPSRPRPDPAVIAKQEALLARLASPPRDPALESQLPGLSVPTLVLFGTLDRSIPPEMGRIYREVMPNCHLVLVYDAGHALDMDRPEAFASVVQDFLARREGFIVTATSGLINP